MRYRFRTILAVLGLQFEEFLILCQMVFLSILDRICSENDLWKMRGKSKKCSPWS